MARKWKWLGAVVLVLSLAIGLTPAGTAGGKGGKGKKTEMDALDIMVLAGKLEEYARAAKSPRALLAAAELYLQIVPNSMTELKDVKVTTEAIPDSKEKGDPATDTKKPQDPSAVAKELIDMAREYANADEKQGIEGMIKGLKTLGSMKGPHTVVRTVGGFKQQTVTINFNGGQLAKLGFRSSDGPLHVRVDGPNIHVQDICVTAGATWIPGKSGPVNIQVTNSRKQAATYTIFVN